MTTPRIVGSRVDALYTSHRVRLSPDAMGPLCARGHAARKHGAVEYIDTSGAPWELRVPRRSDGHRWMLTRMGHVRILIDDRADGGERPIVVERTEPKPGAYELTDRGLHQRAEFELSEDAEVIAIPGWTVSVIFDAQYIADQGGDADRLLAEASEIAARFGKLLQVKIDRVDLCADVEGFAFTPADVANLVHHGRAGVTLYEDGAPVENDNAHDATTYFSGRRFTGCRVGSGPFGLRIYDKIQELSGDPDKLERERARWSRADYQGGDVWRVEYQIRGVVLAEFAARSPLVADVDRSYTTPKGALRTARGTGELMTFGERIAGIWSACLRAIRLTVPRLSRSGAEVERTRRALDARWSLLETVSWSSRVREPRARRVRLRGPAAAAQALGAVMSFAGMLGRLDGPRLSESPSDYVDDPRRKLRELLAALVASFADDVGAALVERFKDPTAAAVHVAARLNASRARFAALARCAPEERNGPWKTERRTTTTAA